MNLNALSKEKQLAEHRFELVHPVSGEPLGVFMSVVSAKSDKAQRFAEKQLRQEQLRELENAKSRKPKFKGLGDMITESRAMAIDRLTGWENVEWNEKPLEFSEQNAEMLLTECDWIVEQIFEHSNDLGKFFKS